MPRITFIEDVTIAGQVGGPHYRRGYQPDVSEDEARKWVSLGKAVSGCQKLPQLSEDVVLEIPTFRRSKRWRGE